MSNNPTRATNFSAWYNTVIKKAGLAENAPVRGCMTIKPYGYAIWENIKNTLDARIKATGHQNLYFPLLIPKSYLSKEANHVEGFAKECAVVTHYRLKTNPKGPGVIVDPEAELEEPLIIRPTSETVIWETYRNWIKSYRDLPLLYNQWANVMRWEMRTRLFLRTSEFLWQEGHTAHATSQEAKEETLRMLEEYARLLEDYLAIPVHKGMKTLNEQFGGAEKTYTVEALMQDGKALQAGTSHFLGQNFAKAFNVQYTDDKGQQQYVWGSCWGVSTRLIGGLIMTHSDDKGLVLPPKIAPYPVVIIPIYKEEATRDAMLKAIAPLQEQLQAQAIHIKIDDTPHRTPGWKFNEYEHKGVPLRLTIGPKELEAQTIQVTRRDTHAKQHIPLAEASKRIPALLQAIQDNLYKRACTLRDQRTTTATTYEAFKQALKNNKGFVIAHWDGTTATEKLIKAETKATIRCIPLDLPQTPGKCIRTGTPTSHRVLFAEAY